GERRADRDERALLRAEVAERDVEGVAHAAASSSRSAREGYPQTRTDLASAAWPRVFPRAGSLRPPGFSGASRAATMPPTPFPVVPEAAPHPGLLATLPGPVDPAMSTPQKAPLPP